MKHSLFLWSAIAFLTLGCEPSELRPVPAFPSGGSGGYSAPSRPGKPQPTTKPLVPDRHQMIDDPDAQTETSTEIVFGGSLAQAEDRCRALAEKYTKEGKSRVSVIKVRQVKGRAYECTFESEVNG